MDNENLFNLLLMETGSPLHLIVSGRGIKGRFIGFKPREYLVIEVPRSAEIDAALTESHEIVGSFCVSGTLLRFETSICSRLKKPAWLVIVAYPSRLSKVRDLRTSYRAQCSLPCTLVSLLNLNQYPGSIADINANGCKCIPSSISLSQARTLFIREKKVLLEFELPGGHGRTRLFGEVANIRRDGAEISLGIKFDGNDDEAAVKELRDYVSNVVRLPST